MKSIFLSTLFALSSYGILNANAEKANVSEEITYESCVSIAARIANGNSRVFRVAYVACIEGRAYK